MMIMCTSKLRYHLISQCQMPSGSSKKNPASTSDPNSSSYERSILKKTASGASDISHRPSDSTRPMYGNTSNGRGRKTSHRSLGCSSPHADKGNPGYRPGRRSLLQIIGPELISAYFLFDSLTMAKSVFLKLGSKLLVLDDVIISKQASLMKSGNRICFTPSKYS